VTNHRSLLINRNANQNRIIHSSSGSKTSEHDYSEQHWRFLYYFNIYRLLIGCSLILISWKFDQTNFGAYRYLLFVYTAAAYAIFGCLCMLLTRLRFSNLDRQLSFQLVGDILFFSIMLYASGGLQSGLGGLAMISLAVAGLISQGRMALFFASIATISLLLQEVYASMTIDFYSAQYSQAGLLSMAYFAVAWLAHQLAENTLRSEKLANERGIDLANMSQVNQLIIQELPEGILVIDEDGNIRQRNALAETMLNLDSANKQSSSLKVSELLPEFVDLLSDWQKQSMIEHTKILRINCTNTLAHVRWVPIQSSTRNGAVIFLEDMGRMEAQLQQLKLAALGRLTTNIAHEIRNPLSAINHAAELLQEEGVQNNTGTRLVHIICDNTRSLNKIVQDILQLHQARVSNPSIINVHHFMEKFLEQFCLSEKTLRNRFNFIESNNRQISFDHDQLNQVLWNLCSNALRHSTKQENSIQIKLSTDTQKIHVILDIINDGPPLDLQKSKQVFEPFYTTAPGGTGLGLFIARELCEANHATLEFVENPIGTQFRIKCKNIMTPYE